MQTLAIANMKGGSGKTSIAVHLADGVRRLGARVLLIDLDQQAHATLWLRGERSSKNVCEKSSDPIGSVTGGAAQVLRRGQIGAEARPVEGREGLDLLAGSADLASLDVALAGEIGAESMLRSALHKHRKRWDLVVIDCPPAMGLATLNALVAADAVLLPVVASHLALSGLAQIIDRLDVIRRRLKRPVYLLGVCLFAADGREGVTAEARRLLRRSTVLLKSEVRVSSAAKVLSASQATALDPGADRRGAEDYAKLTTEVVRLLRMSI